MALATLLIFVAVTHRYGTDLSIKISKELSSRGFKFVGPTIVYAFMQAVGMVNDHLVTCHRHPAYVAKS